MLKGFAAMTRAKRQELASKGGLKVQASGKAHKWNSAEAQAAGTRGGQETARDKKHMSEIGKKGGRNSAAKKKGNHAGKTQNTASNVVSSSPAGQPAGQASQNVP